MGLRLVQTRGQRISFLVLIAGVALAWLFHFSSDHARAEPPGRGPVGYARGNGHIDREPRRGTHEG